MSKPTHAHKQSLPISTASQRAPSAKSAVASFMQTDNQEAVMNISMSDKAVIENALRIAENQMREDAAIMDRLVEQGGNGMITTDAAARMAEDKRHMADEFGEMLHKLSSDANGEAA